MGFCLLVTGRGGVGLRRMRASRRQDPFTRGEPPLVNHDDRDGNLRFGNLCQGNHL